MILRSRSGPVAWLLALASTGVASFAATGDDVEREPVLAALAAEVGRAIHELGETATPPYFIGVELTESHSVRIAGESGGLHGYSPVRHRWLDVDLRIGSRALDSSHPLRSGRPQTRRGGRLVPLGGVPDVLRHELWLEIDERHAEARDLWARVEAESKVLVDEEPTADLVEVAPVRFVGATRELRFDAAAEERKVQRASLALAESPIVIEESATFSGEVVHRWFVSSEGTRIRHAESRYRIDLTATTIAADGERLSLHRAFDAHDPGGLPAEDEVVAAARAMAAGLVELRAAPLEEPYRGPALLSGPAAAVFFHEIFGHRVEGHRLKQVENAQTFRNRVGQPILPPFLSVYDDPTLPDAAGLALRGHYAFDNQGVPAERVTLVEDGILRGFLQSRSPVERGDRANGHGRRSPGRDAESRQGNLIVESAETVPDGVLREELIGRARDAGLAYALYVDEIQGGFTFTDRTIPNAFNISVTRAWRVWVDGRPDEVVRGLDLIGTPLEAFSKIVRVGESPGVFNGNCGAESGWVPVSGVAPALLLESIETQRKRKDQATPPQLPPPLPPRDRPAGEAA